MKLNLQSLHKRLLGSELFSRTQSTLTLQYSTLLRLLLLLFIASVYTLLYVLIWSDQESKLNALLDAEAKALQGPLYADIAAGNFDQPGRRPFELSADQSFYYVVDTAGGIVVSAELQRELSSQVAELVRTGALRSDSLAQVELQVYEEPALPHRQVNAAQRAVPYLAGQRPVYRDGQQVATLYAGKEVEFQKQMFSWLLAAFLGMFLFFLTLVIVFGRWMSRQAMVPVRRAYERQQQFVADASHELRTPLSVLLASVETLDMERGAGEAMSEGWVLEGMRDEIQRMNRLANDLLLLARSDTGQFVPHNVWFDLAATATHTVASLRPLADAQQVELALECPSELMIYQDRDKLVQLIVIFMENGIKYTPPGGKVTLTLAAPANMPGGALRMRVRDTGIGIAAEELPRIFDRFYRPDKARSRQLGGHGLGLAIAKQIVDASGGAMRVESRPGEGSLFEAELPAQGQEDDRP